VRLDFAQFVRSNQAQAGKAIGLSPLAQFLQPREFLGVGRDDDFPADLVRNASAQNRTMAAAPGTQEPGLHRTGLVVDAGMNHPAVVSALVAGNALFFLEKQQTEMRKAARDFERDPEPHSATADDDTS
jgi:hypothetical protein